MYWKPLGKIIRACEPEHHASNAESYLINRTGHHPSPILALCSHQVVINRVHLVSSSQLLLHLGLRFVLRPFNQVLRHSSSLPPGPLASPEPRLSCGSPKTTLPGVFLETLPGDVAAGSAQSGDLLQRAQVLLNVLLAHPVSLTALLLEARGVDLGDDVTDREAEDDKEMLGEEDGQKKSPQLNV
jgi:hypothetical protein